MTGMAYGRWRAKGRYPLAYASTDTYRSGYDTVTVSYSSLRSIASTILRVQSYRAVFSAPLFLRPQRFSSSSSLCELDPSRSTI